MENGSEILSDRISKEEGGAEKGLLSESLSGAHITNGRQSDSAENEVFEDTVTDAEDIYTPQHLEAIGLKNDIFVKLDSGNNGDLSSEQELEGFPVSTGVLVNDQIFEKDKLVSPEDFEPITNSLDNVFSFGQIESAAANATVCSSENRNYSNVSSSAALCADNCTGDSESLNVSVESGEDSFLSQKFADPLEKETTQYSENDAKADGKVEMRENNFVGDESGCAIVESYSVQGHDREKISMTDNESFGGENPEKGVNGDNASFYKSCVVEFRREEDILNKYEFKELQNESIDEIREDNGVQLKADSLFAEEGSAYSVFTSENEKPLEQESRPILESSSTCKEDSPKESDLVEDISELNSTEDDENSNHQNPSSNSRPEHYVSLSLPSRPPGLGHASPLEPASPTIQPSRANGSVPHKKTLISEESLTDDAIEERDEIREKLQMIRVKFLRIAYKLGQTPHNLVVAQVLSKLGIAEQLTRKTNSHGVFSFDRANVMAMELEASGLEPLDFTFTIMVIGKTGVGKSATINSIFDDAKLRTDAFQLGTMKLQVIVGTVQGIKLRVIDTPGLSSYPSDKCRNEKILYSIKRFISKTPPDIVLYVDRLDIRNRDYGDVPLLRTVTDVFGKSIWFNTIVVLTHACSAPPDGPNGNPLSYEMFVTQRSLVVQQAIRQAAGVMLMSSMSLVENHSACRKNRAGQRVLPNGQVWKPQLLLLSFALKILHESDMLLKLDDSSPGKYSRSLTRIPPLPFLLSSLIQSKPHLKLQEEQMDGEDSMFEGLEQASEADDESDYDELPPFKSLTRSQLAKLSKAQRKAYFEELDYREKLYFKKQRKEEKKRKELLKKLAESVPDASIDHNDENAEDNSGGPDAITSPIHRLPLPNSFDSDNPAHLFRFIDSCNKWHVFPTLGTQGWDHDVGYEGLNVERLFAIKDKIPLAIFGKLRKDKNDCTLHMEVASSVKHNEATTSSVGFDVQTAGKDMVYTLRGETKFKNFRCNNTAAGLSVTAFGDSISAGVKFEDKLLLNKRTSMLISGGAITGHGDVAYGGCLEAILQDKNYPIRRGISSISLSVVDWHGDLALGCNIQSQHPLGRGTNVICQGNLGNKGSGQVCLRLNTSDHLQIALISLLPIFRNAIGALFTSFESL